MALIKTFLKLSLLFFLLVVLVYGQKPKIYAHKKDNKGVIELKDANEINNLNINNIEYFIVGDREKYPKDPLIFNSPQDVNLIVSVMIRAMQNFIETKYPNIYGKLKIISWDNNTKLCDKPEDTNNCPSLVLQGTTSFPYRYYNNEVISLNDKFEDYMTNNKYIFSTRFIKQAEYDYSIDGYYVAVPLITDIRIMYYNITTYRNANLDLPPPHGNRKSWGWEDLVKDVETLDKYFEENNINASPFDFYGLYDEEMKFLSIILRNYGVPTISSENRCGYCFSEINLNNTVNTIDTIVKPLFEINKKYNKNHDWCPFQKPNKNIEEWLVSKDKTNNLDEYRNLRDDSLECKMDVENNNTYGIIFSSPPSMAGNKNIITNPGSATNGLGVAYVPGNFSFLGGSGLMITKAANAERRKIAWEYILYLTEEGNYLDDIGKGSLMLPPYDTLLNEKNWSGSDWDVYIQQLRNSFPIQYPRRTFSEFSKLEVSHPLRYMFLDIFERGTDTKLAVRRACSDIDYNLEGNCTINSYKFQEDTCKKGKYLFNVEKVANISCHGNIDIDIQKVKDHETELYVSCPYEDFDTNYGLLILILIIIGITLSVVYISLFTAYRKADPIRKASYLFSVIIVSGSILMYFAVLLDLGKPETKFCYYKIWLIVLGFGCSLGGLVVKAYRIYSIFNNRDLKPLVITDTQLFKYFSIIMVIEVFCLTIWTYIYNDSGKGNLIIENTNSNLKSNDPVIDNKNISLNYNYQYCREYNSLSTVALIYSINCVLILAGCYYSIKTWSIPQMYSETKFVCCSIYMISFIVLVCIPTVSSLPQSDIKNRFILSSLAICFTCILATSVYCIPKIYNSYLYYKRDYVKRDDHISNSLEYSTNNGQIKFMLDNSNNLTCGKSHTRSNYLMNNRSSNGILLTNDTLNRAAMMGNTLIDGNMLGINSSKYNQGLSMLNTSELNSSSLYHKRISRSQIINHELQCPDCGCVFEITE